MERQNHGTLRRLLFYALCCDLGLFSKRMIAPVANLLTDALRIPGGIGTAFSVTFVVLAAALTPAFGCATLISFLQSVIALVMGMTGSMGLLAPIGYLVPGIVTDAVLSVLRQAGTEEKLQMVLTTMLSAASASLTADLLVFHLSGILFTLYLCTALFSGTVCGLLGFELLKRLRPIITA